MSERSEFSKDADLLLECLARLVHRLGGHVEIKETDLPFGPFNLAHRFTDEGVELKLLDGDLQ